MGMVEDRKNWAAAAAEHAERMYAETSNPYYVVLSLAATEIGEFKPHDWALKILLESVVSAWSDGNDGKKMSLDSALGLKTKRGGVPVNRSADKASIEDASFKLIKVIHSCFDVSIPESCEIVYYSIDLSFATDMDEVLWQPWDKDWTQSDLDKIKMTREMFETLEQAERARSQKLIDRYSNNPSVHHKLNNGKWWEVTRGERLGYSLDQLIDRYYRVGTNRAIPSGGVDEITRIYFEGMFLLRIGQDCTFKITNDNRLGINCESALSGKPLRKEFAEFAARCPL